MVLDHNDRRYSYDEPDWLAGLGLGDSRLRRLAAYWDALRGARIMPRFDELEPWKVPDLLPIMWVWRVDRERRLMFLRLVGEEVQRVLGSWPRGAELAEAAPKAVLPLLRRRYEAVAYGPAILYVRGMALLGDMRVPAERLVLPLGAGEQAADDILGISHYDLTPRREIEERAYATEESAETLLPLSALA
ncbi:hypothetical protein SAMN06265365_104120 [Tistlia consotensis]|uniref:PAS domain-containing protein n=1 Tax=Tistlia consotensis USBA 355 TaxID=560819 RepID=A0A1Y6BPY2_9PROT|nr:PAS domain-containing protein [Tistlia consotensis]SMF22339.1 hypothetical protein SAMN05428998_107174 [Tistlia consotensis USBA 355]SNR46077.1 hypothetical protein SAMN06265365_104120 [Tistlia consotensis]